MTGIQFKIIRMARKISAKKIGNKLGFKSKSVILDAEKLETMPIAYIQIFEALTNIQLKDDEHIRTLVIESINSFKNLDYRNSIWKSKYSQYLNIQNTKINGGH